jgi:ABC-type transport system involved in multi-copper enzyme maturation permease subunit
MIRTIAKREFLSNLMSYKFAVGMALCLILLPLGTYVSSRNYQRRLERYELDRDAHQRELTKLHVYSALHPQVDKRPPVLSIIAEGLEERLKSTMRADRHRVPCLNGKGGRMALSRNRYAQAFPSLEIVWLLAIILSLVAVLFAHDTVTGDRELGTLRLTLSNSVPRHQVLLGKYLGGIGSLFIPLLTGFLAALVVMNLSAAVSLSVSDWLAILLIFFLSLVYLSAFFLLGMTVSSLTRRSCTSLIILLAVWVALTELLPHASIFAAKNIIPVASMEKVRAEKNAIEEQKNKEEGKIWQTVRQRMPKGGFQILVNKKDSNEKGQLLRFMSPETAEFLREVFGGEIERVEVKYADKIAWQDQSYVRQLERQWWLADILSAPSLARPFSSTVRALAGTDVEAFKAFVEKARQYRLEVLAFLEAQVASNPYRFFTDDPVEEIQKDWPRALREERISRAELGEKMKTADGDPRRLLDLTSMPRFSPPKEGVLERLSRRWSDLTILLLSNVGLFLLAFLFFLRYDPR